MYLTNFYSIQPPYPKNQTEGLKWLAAVYKIAQRDQAYTEEEYSKLLNRVACPESQIGTRKFFLPDSQHTEWEKQIIYPIKDSPRGATMQKRHEFFHKTVGEIFNKIYETRPYPDDIIHVSCTGYISPSAAQMVAVRAPKNVTVTHSYHMGCYGAFPALRMASGFLSSTDVLGNKNSVDLVHTELCSLHLNPQDPTLEQMVIQSLFADGAIAYSMTTKKPDQGFRILSLYEELVPDTAGAMEWMVSDYGMKMSLSKDVPMLVGKKIREFTSRWLESRGENITALAKKALFAVHPGGPKIIDQVAKQLELSDEQVKASREILKDRGNMSSATLPHLWERLSDDKNIPSGTPIISYAFGPGLTICASLMEKL
ncbi:3-oxoacyl-[acyl-carrier-protein] synthase III C-terminal domain-containing protein [Bdellovibrio sp. HCB-162]|uniref:3-oxoacyl-[acyl-carrier-protein] synthase III C-terminal domain-containing protein n=1 Tax=Bdellovibrio sp. HCB-162 TaxID=3394234 RepID=UPI0039BD88F1